MAKDMRQISNISGSWTMDKALSTDPDPLLRVQGVGWIKRNVAKLATVTLHFEATQEPSGVKSLIVTETIVGGIPGSQEKWIFDWKEYEHSHPLFGRAVIRSELASATVSKERGTGPEFTLVSKLPEGDARALAEKFLKGQYARDTSGDHSECREGYDVTYYIHDYIESQAGNWTAEQIWGFEDIGSQKRLTRRICVTNGTSYELGRLVFTPISN